MMTIAIANQKGGVGKTTLSYNLAHILASKRSTSVLAVDNDAQAHLTGSFLAPKSEITGNVLNIYEGKPVTPQKIKKDLYLIGADGRLAHVTDGNINTIYLLKDCLDKYKGVDPPNRFDYAIIDSLPSASFIQMAALTAADYVLIPVKPAPYAIKGMVDFLKLVEKVKCRLNPDLKVIGIALNLVDGRKPNLERDMEAALRETYGKLVFKSKINKRVNIEASPAFRQPITEYEPKSTSAGKFKALTKEIVSRIKKEGRL